jgi:hypothetical protein
VINGGNDRFQQRLQQRETSLNIYTTNCHHLFKQKYYSNFEIKYRIFYISIMNKIANCLNNHITYINKRFILYIEHVVYYII